MISKWISSIFATTLFSFFHVTQSAAYLGAPRANLARFATMARLFVYSKCNSHNSRAHIVCGNARRAPKIYREFNMTSYSHRHSCSRLPKKKTQNTNAAFAFTFRFSHCLHSIHFLGVKCLIPKEMPIVAKQTLREREKRERECRINETIRQAVARGLFIKKKNVISDKNELRNLISILTV